MIFTICNIILFYIELSRIKLKKANMFENP